MSRYNNTSRSSSRRLMCSVPARLMQALRALMSYRTCLKVGYFLMASLVNKLRSVIYANNVRRYVMPGKSVAKEFSHINAKLSYLVLLRSRCESGPRKSSTLEHRRPGRAICPYQCRLKRLDPRILIL